MIRENRIEAYLVKLVEKAGGVAYKFTSPGRAGVPDRKCCFPGGRIFYAETKAPVHGRLSPEQHREIRRLRRMGFTVYVPNTKDAVDALMDAEGFSNGS